jgi:beta-lactamase regulating signal transducer with metallopeptidase domain
MSPAAFNDWSASVTSLAIAIFLQSTILAGLVAGICWLLRRSAPSVRYWCWQIVALKLLLMPCWIVAVPLPDFFGAEGATGISPRTTVATEDRGTPGAAKDRLLAPPTEAAGLAARKTPSLFYIHRQLTWRSWLVLAWLAGLVWQAARLSVQHSRLRKLLSRATVAADPRLLTTIDEVAARLGLSRRPNVVLTEGQGAPFVCGLFRPLLALPRELVADLDAVQLRDVLLHEVSHLKRRDLWWGWLPALARVVYFYHPVAHWVCFRIRLERELACDQLAMALGGRSAAEYAEALFQVISRASMPAVPATNSLEGLSTFWKRRITMLVSTSQTSPRLSRVTCFAIATAALAACLLPTFQRVPVQAEDPTSAKASGRIYVGTMYRLKPEGAEDDKTVHSAIVAIDPATGDWQTIVEKDATVGSAGDAVRLSPDRRTLISWRHRDGIWKCESDGQFPIKIFDQDDRSFNGLLRPVWSADGKHLAVTKTGYIKTDSKGVWQSESWQIDADGRNAVKLPIPDTDSIDDWSGDGQWFVTSAIRPPHYLQLYLMKTDGTQERRLTEGGGNSRARFSPDGKKILYLHRTNAEGSSIWTVDVDGGNATDLINEADPSVPDGAFWSPDGKQIAVVLFDWQFKNGQKRHPSLDPGAHRIEIMDADGTNRRQIRLEGAEFLSISSMGDWR